MNPALRQLIEIIARECVEENEINVTDEQRWSPVNRTSNKKLPNGEAEGRLANTEIIEKCPNNHIVSNAANRRKHHPARPAALAVLAENLED